MSTGTSSSEIFWIQKEYCGFARIGIGGMGEVWIGKAFGAHNFERIVAIKKLGDAHKRKASLHQAMRDEAVILSHLTASPHIVSIWDLLVDDGQPYLIMEYVDGPELADVLKEARRQNLPLPFSLSAYIVDEVSKALSYAHSAVHPKTGQALKIIHRDVTPSNILLSSQGAVKLSDFGIAKSELQSAQTQFGEIKGKFRYMSPEQAQGLELNERSDYFSLGLLFFECLTGQAAYQGQSDQAVLAQASAGKVDLQEIGDSELRNILQKLLAVNATNRYANLEEFRTELGQLVFTQGSMGTAEKLAGFLRQLNLPQLKKAIELKHNVEQSPLPLFEATQTHVNIKLPRPKWQRHLLFVAISSVLFFGFLLIQKNMGSKQIILPSDKSFIAHPTLSLSGELEVTTSPINSLVALEFGETKLKQPAPFSIKDIPLGVPLALTISQTGYQTQEQTITLDAKQQVRSLSVHLQKLPEALVQFQSTPPSAEVTIPGVLQTLDVPSPFQKIAGGKYQVIFTHPLTTLKARTTLDTTSGGRFLCSANMALDLGTREPIHDKTPSASCRKI